MKIASPARFLVLCSETCRFLTTSISQTINFPVRFHRSSRI
ncbi:BnaA01g08390D [Brassica napus]|uniref:BnaA01g08390D protein n=1 Tax=Brassica napus TaxID=3708 RepID=A0A078HBR8_BRANA|nr:BnaA01g08390D [Brassica napus]